LTLLVQRVPLGAGWDHVLTKLAWTAKKSRASCETATCLPSMSFYVLANQTRAQKGLKKLEQVAWNKYHIEA
jgi:hypothetical protein